MMQTFTADQLDGAVAALIFQFLPHKSHRALGLTSVEWHYRAGLTLYSFRRPCSYSWKKTVILPNNCKEALALLRIHQRFVTAVKIEGRLTGGVIQERMLLPTKHVFPGVTRIAIGNVFICGAITHVLGHVFPNARHLILSAKTLPSLIIVHSIPGFDLKVKSNTATDIVQICHDGPMWRFKQRKYN